MTVKLPVAKLDDFFAALSAKTAVYLPSDNSAGQSEFRRWESGVKLSSRLNTTRSAKDFFFPQTEDIVDFNMKGKTIEVIDRRTESEDFVVFGARACDVASFAILDSVYLADPVDSFYKNRREHGVVVSLACARPDSTCFCPLFGIDATEPSGDVTGWIAGEDLYLKPNTEKGTDLVASLGAVASEAKDLSAVDRQKKETGEILARLPFAKRDMGKFGGEKLIELFNSPKWAGLSEACLGCGTCTFVCPTCQCYDIRDFDSGHGVKRFRCWDSCMYSDFTKMAHGNPRLTQVERFRQRFMHKLVYYPSNNGGKFGCVGCGRCLKSCPISMNIVKVMKALSEEK